MIDKSKVLVLISQGYSARNIADTFNVTPEYIHYIARTNKVKIIKKEKKTKKITGGRRWNHSVWHEDEFTTKQWDRINKIRALMNKGRYWDEFPVSGIFKE